MEALFRCHGQGRHAVQAGYVTYTSPEFDELETVVEVCEPLYETEKPTMQAPVEQGPEPVIFVSPEFDEIETLM